MAGTTPVTIHEEIVSSSKGIRDNCALSTDEIHTLSLIIEDLPKRNKSKIFHDFFYIIISRFN